MRDGILSPDNKTVSHESEWVPAVISPNGDMYFHSGEWHPLANKIIRSEATSNSISNTSEVDSYSAENQISKDAILKQIFSGVICVILFWYIFDSGEIISNWDVATEVDCSVLSDFEEFGWDELESDCDDEVFTAILKVLFSIIGILWLISYIQQLNKINPRTELQEIEQRKKSQLAASERTHRFEEKRRKRKREEKRQNQLNYLIKRLEMLQNIEKLNIKLSGKNLDLEKLKKKYDWENYEGKISERKQKFLNLCLVILAIGVFLSVLPFVYVSTNYQLFLESSDRNQIYLLVVVSCLILFFVALTPIFIFKKYHSIPLIKKENPVPKLIAEVEGLSAIIGRNWGYLNNLDKNNDPRKKFRGLDSVRTKKLIKKMGKILEELDE
ncbi:hypothetical protein OAJ45_03810 [Candidatus Poseidoniales archaeon]|nr:hypothetical protein [Candidatus Poseidoniales archaeon]